MAKVNVSRRVKRLNDRLNEKQQIEMGLKHWGGKAYRDTLSKGLPVTVLRGNKVCRVTENRRVSVLSEVPQSRYKITRRSYKLKK